MNRRCIIRPNAQWIRITGDNGPFHRQYRHQQNLHRNLRHWEAASEHEVPSPTSHTDVMGAPNLRRQQFLSLRLSHQTDHTYRQRKGQPTNDLLGNHDDPKWQSDYATNFPALQSTANGAHNNNNGPTTQILWFRTNTDQRPKVITLLDRFDSAGMIVHVCNSFEGLNSPRGSLLHTLIMLECVDTIEHEMLLRLERIRSQSNAPLIILTDNTTLDWSLLALREGADAIFTLNTPDEIILARSHALLRRWTLK